VAVDRSLAILSELRSTLKVEEGGEIAQSLDKMYTYLTARILEASQKLNVAPLDESMKLLRILNSAWTEIAEREQNPGNSGPAAKLPAAGVPANPASRSPLEIFG
jgi:flagellar biosynthetic protein FliS